MMDYKVAITLAFAVGTVFGGASTYIYAHKKNEKKLDEQIQPVRDEFNKVIQQMEEDKKKFEDNLEASVREKIENEEKAKEVKDLKQKTEDLSYKKKGDHPYLIDRGGEEFGGHMAVSLEYYADGVLLDGRDIVDDNNKDSIVGIENLALLCEEHPEIWVRNDRLRVDYEISYVDEDFYPDEE